MYGWDEGEKFIPIEKPFPTTSFPVIQEGYQLMVNIYLHTMLH
jgi:hypothetical protein